MSNVHRTNGAKVNPRACGAAVGIPDAEGHPRRSIPACSGKLSLRVASSGLCLVHPCIAAARASTVYSTGWPPPVASFGFT